MDIYNTIQNIKNTLAECKEYHQALGWDIDKVENKVNEVKEEELNSLFNTNLDDNDITYIASNL